MPEATYSIGLPQHPSMTWDDVSRSMPRHSPTLGDRALLVEWEAKLEAAEAIHPSGKITLDNAVTDIEQGIERLYGSTFAGKPATFKVTGTAIPCGRLHAVKFPYPRTENWQKAIGYHVIWLSADVSVVMQAGRPCFSMVMTLHGEDKYNFNPGNIDIATGTPDDPNAELEAAGLARSFMHYSTLQRTVRWTNAGPPEMLPTNQNRVRQPQDNFRVRNRV